MLCTYTTGNKKDGKTPRRRILSHTRINQTGEWALDTLPVFGQNFKANVLCNRYALEGGRQGKQFVVFEFSSSFLGRGEDVHLSGPELEDDRTRHMHISIEANGHYRCACSLSRTRNGGVG